MRRRRLSLAVSCFSEGQIKVGILSEVTAAVVPSASVTVVAEALSNVRL